VNSDPQRACRAEAGRRRDSIFIPQSWDSSDVLDHTTSEIASGSKLGIDATKKLPANPESFRGWPPLIKMDEATRNKIDSLFKTHP